MDTAPQSAGVSIGPVSGHSKPQVRSFKSLRRDLRRSDISGTPRKCGNRPKRWVFSQTGLAGYVKAPAAGSPSFAAGVFTGETGLEKIYPRAMHDNIRYHMLY